MQKYSFTIPDRVTFGGVLYRVGKHIVFTLPSGPGCSKARLCYPPDKSLLTGYCGFVLLTLIHWIAIYPVDSIIQPLNNWGLIVRRNS